MEQFGDDLPSALTIERSSCLPAWYSTYQISHKNGHPIGCNTNDRVFTKICGLGWRFGIGYDDSPHPVDIYFDSFQTPHNVEKFDIHVTLLRSKYGETLDTKETEHVERGHTETIIRVASFTARDITLHPFLKIKVENRPTLIFLPHYTQDSVLFSQFSRFFQRLYAGKIS
jgi:hypothetical protein